MIRAVTKIVPISAQIPATTGFGVHPYSIFENQMPRKTMAWVSFMGASDAF